MSDIHIQQRISLFLHQPLLVHIGLVLFLLWLASFFHVSSFWVFFIAFLFLYEVNRNYVKNVRRQIRSEERRSAYQSRPLSDFETVQWLNNAIERIWQPFLEQFLSQHFLAPMVPWFLDKYKPWTVKKATMQRLYLGRRAPIFTGIRILDRTSDDDDLVLDLGLDFLAADDMDALLSVQLRRRLGFGIWTNIHISKLQIEGKVRVGIKFSNGLPFLSRVRICFDDAPYVQITARPLSTHGINVSEVPLIAGWMERLVANVFEQCLVEPNMLVLDIEKLIGCMTGVGTPNSSRKEDWFKIDEKPPIATVHLEVIEAVDLKPSDLNGFADPYVKGSFLSYHFKTKIEKKTCSPRWHEVFDFQVMSWKRPVLVLQVFDKDQFRDDYLGLCEVNLAEYTDGQRYDLWIPLKEVKMGRLHIVLKITEAQNSDSTTATPHPRHSNDETVNGAADAASEKPDISEKLEFINLGNGNVGFISVVSPGQIPTTTSWQQREGMKRNVSNISAKSGAGDSSEESSPEEKKTGNKSDKHLWSRRQTPSDAASFKDYENAPTLQVVRDKKGTTTYMDAGEPGGSFCLSQDGADSSPETPRTMKTSPLTVKNVDESPTKRRQMKDMAKGIAKHAGKALGAVLTRRGSGGRASQDADSTTSSSPEESKTLS